jgi:hypothetical protein
MPKKKRGSKAGKKMELNFSSISTTAFEKDIKNLSDQELRELVMVNIYKMALLRSQVETVTNILIKNKMTTYEEVWKETNENFKNTF